MKCQCPFQRSTSFFVLAVCLSCCAVIEGAPHPNILFFHADQHNARVMGCAGHLDVKTPTLDRLAANGVRFERAYTQAGICTPSRTSLMTGLYPRITGVLWNSNQDDGQVHDNVRIEPMAAWLQRHGYRTAAIGRRHLAEAADIGWTHTAPEVPFQRKQSLVHGPGCQGR